MTHPKVFLLFMALTISLCSCSLKRQQTSSADNPPATIEYQSPITFDFRQYQDNPPRDIPGMKATSPSGDTIVVNSSYITLNGEPWIPSYGEFNYQRYPEEQWEDALLKLKSQGFTGVSTYIFWIGHEEVEGQWEFTGNKNLRRFIELCQKHGLLFFARIGPWVNGEIRNGGHPDWLMERLGDPENIYGHGGSGGRLRSTDPEYFAAVDKFYQKIAEQMKGLYWKDGGPIFAIQLDNEYTPAHSGIGGTKLIEWEKETALKYGMDVPLYTTTGWNKAEFIQDHTIQCHGSYADYYWAHADDYFRTPAFSFSTLRAVDGIDTSVNHFDSESSTDIEKYITNPYLSCETGIGMHQAYHRRPNIDPMDNGAVSLVELGSGAVGMGYFMSVGGTSMPGKNGYMNRDNTQVPMDMPVFSNDYQAAIGEFGQVRESFYEYPVQMHFMRDFGKYLAPLKTHISPETDELRGVDVNISSELQRAVRSDGKSGFMFVNNHVKFDEKIVFENVQFEIKLAQETLKIPEEPVNIPVDAYFYWPYNLKLPGFTIKQASAQPVLHLEESNTYVFFKNDGIRAEFIFDNQGIQNAHVNNGEVILRENTTAVEISEAGLDTYIDLSLDNNEKIRILVLTQTQAKQLYRHQNRLYLSDAEVLLFNDKGLEVISEETSNSIWVYPNNPIKELTSTKIGLFEQVNVQFKPIKVTIDYEQTQDGKALSFVNKTFRGQERGNTIAPDKSLYAKGSIYSLKFPNGIPESVEDVRVKIDYQAAALRLYKNGQFIYDDYYNGDAWEFGVKWLVPEYSSSTKLELKLLPLQPDDDINIGGVYWPELGHKENVLDVHSIKAVPVYRGVFRFK